MTNRLLRCQGASSRRSLPRRERPFAPRGTSRAEAVRRAVELLLLPPQAAASAAAAMHSVIFIFDRLERLLGYGPPPARPPASVVSTGRPGSRKGTAAFGMAAAHASS